MTKTDWWETFTKTGCVTDYLSYKGIGKEEYSCEMCIRDRSLSQHVWLVRSVETTVRRFLTRRSWHRQVHSVTM